MIKIAVTGTRGFPGVQGGVEKHCEELYPRIAQRGCEITVFTRSPYVNPDILTYKGVSLLPVDCSTGKYREAISHTLKSILRARAIKADIIHIHAIGPSVLAFLARLFGLRVVVTHHGADYRREKWPLLAKLFLRFAEWAGMQFANAVITLTADISDDLRRKYKTSAYVIPNGVLEPETTGTDETLTRLGLSRKKYILAVGRLVPEKGFADLVDAFTLNRLAGWKLVIVGRADHEDGYFRALSEKVAGSSSIILTGFLSGTPLSELYSHAGLFVLPSYHEGLPIVLLEAMSYGLSCLASDIPANRNVGLDSGRYFRVGDIEGLSRMLLECIRQPLGDAERSTQVAEVLARFNWDRIAGETLNVYRVLTEKKR